MDKPEKWVNDAKKWLAQADAVITDNDLVPSEYSKEYEEGLKAVLRIIKAFGSLR